MALPYFAVALVPAVARLLPRPGPWMVTLKRVLGLALAGTAVWLITVLAGVTGGPAAGVVGFLMAAMVGFLAAGKVFGGPFQKAAAVGAAGLAIVALVVPVSADGGRIAPPSGKLPELWQPFAPETIPALVAEGADRLRRRHRRLVRHLPGQQDLRAGARRGDEPAGRPQCGRHAGRLTRPDDGISRYLAKYGRYGIPFNAVYGPGAPEGVLLPELLTEDAVLEAFAKAGNG